MSGWIAAADAWGPPPPPPVPPTAPPTAPAPRRATAADKQAALEAEIEQLRRELTAAKRGEGRRKEGAASSLATQQQAVSAAATRLAEVHAMLTVAPLASLPDASAAAAVELAARKAAEAAEHLARVARLQGQMAATLKGGGGSATADPAASSAAPSARLFFGQLLPRITSQQIEEVVSQFGVVNAVKLCLSERGARAFAFVEFAEQAAADRAIAQLNGQVVEKLSGTKKAIVEYPKTPSRPSATAAATAAAAAAAALGKPLPSGTAGSSGALSALAAEWRPTPAEAQAARPGRGRWGEDPGAAAAASSSLGIVDVLEEQESLAAQLLLPSQLLDSPISPPDPRQSDTPPLPLPLPLPLSSLGQSKH